MYISPALIRSSCIFRGIFLTSNGLNSRKNDAIAVKVVWKFGMPSTGKNMQG